MTHQKNLRSIPARLLVACLALGFAAGCGGKKNTIPANTTNPDRYLFDRGTEALKEKDGIRRHQWIAFRRFQGQNQQVNVMVSTNGEKFDKQKDIFAAIMYSMKIAKG